MDYYSEKATSKACEFANRRRGSTSRCNGEHKSRPDVWALKLQAFRLEKEHRRGWLNVVPDALSRVNKDEISSI